MQFQHLLKLRDGLFVAGAAEGDLPPQHEGVRDPVAIGVFSNEAIQQFIRPCGVTRVEQAEAQRKNAMAAKFAVREQPQHLLIPLNGLFVPPLNRQCVADQDQCVVDQGTSRMVPQDKTRVFDREFVGSNGLWRQAAVGRLLAEPYALPFLERFPGVVEGIVVRAPEKHARGRKYDQRGPAHVSLRTCIRPPGRS